MMLFWLFVVVVVNIILRLKIAREKKEKKGRK